MATNWDKFGERGVSRGTRLDLTLIAMRRLVFPSSKNQIVKAQGLKATPYMNSILEQLVRDGFALCVSTQRGRRTDNLYSLTPEGEKKAREVVDAYANDPTPDALLL